MKNANPVFRGRATLDTTSEILEPADSVAASVSEWNRPSTRSRSQPRFLTSCFGSNTRLKVGREIRAWPAIPLGVALLVKAGTDFVTRVGPLCTKRATGYGWIFGCGRKPRVEFLGLGVAVFAVCLGLAGCQKAAPRKTASIPGSPAEQGTAVPRYTYEVVNSWPHDRGAFTQGLLVRGKGFIESTGLNGQSSLREVELETGRVIKQVPLAAQYFGEGVAVLGSRAYMLTWQNQKAFVYDADTFQLQREFSYTGEGWGLTTDGRLLIMSDGTSRLRFLDPETFAVVRTIDVTLNGQSRERLNELEFISGEIFANVWQMDIVVRIDPTSGRVVGVIDFSGLLPPQDRQAVTDVLNGIAYDAERDRLFVTGKRWPRIFEVRLKRADQVSR